MPSALFLSSLISRVSLSEDAALHAALLEQSREVFCNEHHSLPLPSLSQYSRFVTSLSRLYPLYQIDCPTRSTALRLFVLLLGFDSIQPPPLRFHSVHEELALLDFVRLQQRLQLCELSEELRQSPRLCLRQLSLVAHLWRDQHEQDSGRHSGRSDQERLVNVRVVSFHTVEVDKACLSASAGSFSGRLHAFEGTVHRIGRVQSIPVQREEVEDDWRAPERLRCQHCPSSTPPWATKKVKVELKADTDDSQMVDVQTVDILLSLNPAALTSQHANSVTSSSHCIEVKGPRTVAQQLDTREQAKHAVARRLSQDLLLPCVLHRDLVGSVRLTDRVRVIGYPRLAEKQNVEAKKGAKALIVLDNDDDEHEESYALLVHSVVINPAAELVPTGAVHAIVSAFEGQGASPLELLTSRPLSLAMPADLPSEVNAGLLLSMMSAFPQDEATDGGAGVHVLLIVGPNHQSILAPLALLHPHSVYVSSLPTSTPLWATERCSRDGIEQMGGALMQSNGGVCLIDDIDRHVASLAATHRLTHFLRTGEDLVIGEGDGSTQVELRSSATVIATTRGRWTEYDDNCTLMENVMLPVEVVAAFDLVLVAGLANRGYQHSVEQLLEMDQRWRDVDGRQAQRDVATALPPLLSPSHFTTFLTAAQQASHEQALRVPPRLVGTVESWYCSMKALSLMNGHLPQQLRPSPRLLRTLLQLCLAYSRTNRTVRGAPDYAVQLMRACTRDLCRDWDGQEVDLAEAAAQTAAAAAPAARERINPTTGQLERFWKLLTQQRQDEVDAAFIQQLAKSGPAKAIGLSGDREQTNLLIEGLSARHNEHFLRIAEGTWKIQR